MTRRLTAREKRNQDAELRRQNNSNVGGALAAFLAEPDTDPMQAAWERAMGMGGYAGSPAEKEARDSKAHKSRPQSFQDGEE